MSTSLPNNWVRCLRTGERGTILEVFEGWCPEELTDVIFCRVRLGPVVRFFRPHELEED